MSRLKKIAMDMNAIKNVINQSSTKGRKILKELEDFKFTLEQTARLLNNDQSVAQGMIKKRKAVDEISTKLYQIVFDIENLDITESFSQQNPQSIQDAPPTPPSVPEKEDKNGTDNTNGEDKQKPEGDSNDKTPTPPANQPVPPNKDTKTDDKEDNKKEEDNKDEKGE